MRVMHYVSLGDSLTVGSLLLAVEAKGIPGDADIEWNYDRSEMRIEWYDD